MIQLDNIHYSYRSIDGYNKSINFIVSPRGDGKTAMAWLTKIYLPWKKSFKPWIYLVRKSVEITEALITSISDTILNKFTDDNVELQYNKGSFNEGIVDVKINGKLFFRIVSLSIDLRRIKLAVLKNIGGVLMDEYIIDPKTGEKYTKNESFKLKEAYTTWARESEGKLKFYFLGNPYSLYNPVFMWLGVDTNKLKSGTIQTGDIWIVECATLSEELKKWLLEHNPLYEFDDEYKKYAFEGLAINDSNIKVSKCPLAYSLRFVIRHENNLIGIYQNNYIEDLEDRYHCEFIDELSSKRTAYAFEFSDLVNNTILMSNDEKNRLNRFKIAIRKRLVTFADVNVYYIIEEIYNLI